ncbi:MAG: isoaspartyl peptidase/L-asparaginase family protein [candidate division WOR-3 bacterium]
MERKRFPRLLAIHGGAGRWQEKSLEKARAGIKEALEAGYSKLKRTNSALKAVLEAVRIMEENPIFNCGKGSSLTIDGKVQMDASLMTSDGRFGAVGAIEGVKHPIDIAYKVMTETNHFLIVGEGAKKLARFWGFPPYNPYTKKAREALFRLRKKPKLWYLPNLRRYLSLGTVGAIALDPYGRFAAANSTGGYTGKLPGRIGDTPIYGAGTWACPEGAVVGTGVGEELIRSFLCKKVGDLLRKYPAQKAINLAIKGIRDVGVIAIDKRGNIGSAFTARAMPWGYCKEGEIKVF